MAEEKNFPTPGMLKAREEWAKMPEEEKNALLEATAEEIIRHRERCFSPNLKWQLQSGEYEGK